ncbi:sodium/proton-translocating pyrophosphatase [Streptomyces sp. NPDC002490]|uniref:sodium/proton-translocating pyrophosphatase n=1 Tax=Streptomyces sp. NPDC002490 TaxID=3154416 RepID=UPI0033306D65
MAQPHPRPDTSHAAAVLTTDLRLTVMAAATVAVAALLVAAVLAHRVRAADEGTDRTKRIAAAVREGARTHLTRHLRTLALLVAIGCALLLLLPAADGNQRAGRSVSFLLGAGLAALSGHLGTRLAVLGGARVAAASRAAVLGEPRRPGPVTTGTAPGAAVLRRTARLAFRTGGAVGVLTAGLALLGVCGTVLVHAADAPEVLTGFGLGAALVAVFLRLGGGLFARAADPGAGLVTAGGRDVAKDDPRHAAALADLVGNGVGDGAGTAADLFAAHAVSLVVTLLLGRAALGDVGLAFPLLVSAIGVVATAIGIFAVGPRRTDPSGTAAIGRGFPVAAATALALVGVAAFLGLPSSFAALAGVTDPAVRAAAGDPRVLVCTAVAVGIAAAALARRFAGAARRPGPGTGGPAAVVGTGAGLRAAAGTALLVGLTAAGAFLLGGASTALALFAVALAGSGLLTTVGVLVAVNALGPVTDTARGVLGISAEEHGAGSRALAGPGALGDAAGAVARMVTVAASALAATALLGASRSAAGAPHLAADPARPAHLLGLLAGAAVVCLFAGAAIGAATRSADAVVREARRQLRERPGITERTERPGYGRVVDLCTRDALRESSAPGLLAVLAPVAVGFALGPGPLGAFLAGAIATGVLLAAFLAHCGDGVPDGPGDRCGAGPGAAGGPFRDTVGPAVDPLLTAMGTAALLIVPAVHALGPGPGADPLVRALIAVTACTVLVLVAVRAAVARRDHGPHGAAEVDGARREPQHAGGPDPLG